MGFQVAFFGIVWRDSLHCGDCTCCVFRTQAAVKSLDATWVNFARSTLDPSWLWFLSMFLAVVRSDVLLLLPKFPQPPNFMAPSPWFYIGSWPPTVYKANLSYTSCLKLAHLSLDVSQPSGRLYNKQLLVLSVLWRHSNWVAWKDYSSLLLEWKKCPGQLRPA